MEQLLDNVEERQEVESLWLIIGGLTKLAHKGGRGRDKKEYGEFEKGGLGIRGRRGKGLHANKNKCTKKRENDHSFRFKRQSFFS